MISITVDLLAIIQIPFTSYPLTLKNIIALTFELLAIVPQASFKGVLGIAQILWRCYYGCQQIQSLWS